MWGAPAPSPQRVANWQPELVRFDRLTPSEKNYLRAMAGLGPGPHRSGDIAEKLNGKVNSLGPTRSSLIAKGMIYSPEHGDTAFTVPLFDQFMKRMFRSCRDSRKLKAYQAVGIRGDSAVRPLVVQEKVASARAAATRRSAPLSSSRREATNSSVRFVTLST